MAEIPVLKKLQFYKASACLIINAPDAYQNLLRDLAYDTSPSKEKEGIYDFVQVFASRQPELEKLVKKFSQSGRHDCIFWACYPKGGKLNSDIKRETVWTAFDMAGLQAVSSVSIDDTWTALRARPADRVGSFPPL